MSSILQYPEVWNNEAFDDGDSEDSLGLMIKSSSSSSWWNQSLESSCSKENMNPVLEKSAAFFKPSIPTKPLKSNNIIVNSQGNNSTVKLNNPLKIVLKRDGLGSKNVSQEDETKIDEEIEAIEKEISRLSSRLESLRLEKVERSLKIGEKKGKAVPAKFMEPKQTVKIEKRRGMSLGPSEIYSATKARLFNKQEVATPVSTKNRRKSCFWKLEEVDELKATKERGKSSSLSPKSRKIQAPKMAATTVGSRKLVKKEVGVIASIQPKTLFKDGEKSVPNRKLVKPGRVIPSRYNQIGSNVSASEARKRSLPDSDKEDANKRRSRETGVNQRVEISCSRGKKKCEVPNELVVPVCVVEESVISNSLKGDVLPKIKTFRCVNETPRDSGAAKRVADLVGKKSFFCIDEGEETAEDSVCQTLRFDFEEDEEEL
ncbi:uncharacterized protein LOC126657670 [Mercurialis annua]|uniref:uncharacterized protein LOC126657670 n=1 Tax=Mercurialis annua TaxID=3986 RepID=UPI00215E6FCC|nr:uncharacterized protein LOC126657670 [Mercurialis annua]